MNSISSEKYQQCTRCIMDTTVPGIFFDKTTGECNFCKLHDKMEKEFPLGAEGEKKTNKIFNKVKASGRGKKYNCVLGVSGGRDSIYTAYLAKKVWGLNPILVHFNNGFGNPVAGENMIKAAKKLDVELRTITSDWRESKDLKIAFLKASTIDVDEAADIGIAAALYSVAAKENIKYILIGQSFRTEGISPLSWNYLDGKYMKAVHKQFGTIPLRKWKPTDPGFNLDIKEMVYYTIWRGIKTIPILYYVNYIRKDAEEVIKRELEWEYPGAHYFDDLYQSLMSYIYRQKFKFDRRVHNYSALVRCGQMTREEALESVKKIYVIEDPKVISLCIKRIGLTQEEFDGYMKLPIKSFRDYPNNYSLIKKAKILIKIMCKLNFLPCSAYDKYFNCGE